LITRHNRVDANRRVDDTMTYDLIMSPEFSKPYYQGLIKVHVDRECWGIASRREIDLVPSRDRQSRYALEKYRSTNIDGNSTKRRKNGRKSGALSAEEGSQVEKRDIQNPVLDAVEHIPNPHDTQHPPTHQHH
ncbi:hypothetical protein KCU62_g332, partial [Aureobasidium sp. EXF-3399]